MKFLIGKSSVSSAGVKVDLEKLLGARLLIQANSGGGKSWAIRRLLEQTHGSVLQLVIDVEDEFHTLREKYDYILAGRDGGDCPADPKSAALLARRLLELGTSTILGIHELKARERVQFVRRFLDGLVGAPRKLWRPALVVVDEAHVFAPQNGQSEAASAVIDLMTRGRKRGLCGILATQRISKLHKDAAAEANCKLIGRSALDVDMKRAAEELGLSGKAEQRRLRTLKPGNFYAFGPAISDTVVQVRVGGVKTTHPTLGQRAAPPAPPPERVKKVLAQLADIPKEAAAEERTVEDLRRQVAQLQRELGEARRKAEDAARSAGVPTETVTAMQRSLHSMKEEIESVVDSAAANVGALLTRVPLALPPRPAPAAPRSAPAPRAKPAPSGEGGGAPSNGIGKGPQALLAALASLGGGPATKEQIAILAGYRPRSSTVRNYLGELRRAGCVEGSGDRLTLSPEGAAAAGPVDPPRTTPELLEMWCRQLGAGPARILKLAVASYPSSLTKEDIEDATGYKARSSTLRNYLGELRRAGLIEPRGDCRASATLFPNN